MPAIAGLKQDSGMRSQAKIWVAVVLFIVGIVDLLPATLVIAPGRSLELYGVLVESPVLTLLMRHRAVLEGLIGLGLMIAAFRPSLRPTALTAGIVSKLSFALVVLISGGSLPSLHTMAWVQFAGLLLLIIASWGAAGKRADPRAIMI